MANYICPLCGSVMHAEFRPSSYPGIPDRTWLHCPNKVACDLSCTSDDLPTIDALQYAGAVLTAQASSVQMVRAS